MKIISILLVSLFSVVSMAEYHEALGIHIFRGEAVVGINKAEDKTLQISDDAAIYMYDLGFKRNGPEPIYTGADGSSITQVKIKDFTCQKVIAVVGVNQTSTMTTCSLDLGK